MKKKIIILLILIALIALAATRKPVIWKADCVGCGDCLNACPVSAITIQSGKAVINQEKCINCKICLESCHYQAIR